jgi:glycosyltransferase involved in cell wall biosynthesis
MRIALFHNLPSGGAKRTVSEAVRRLTGRHQVDVFTLTSAEHAFGDVRASASAHYDAPFTPRREFASPFGRLNPIVRWIELGRLERVARGVGRQIDRGGYDVALVHPCRVEQAPSVLCHLTQTPSVYYCHEPLRLIYEEMPARPYDDRSNARRRVLNGIDPLPRVYRNSLRRVDQRNTARATSVLANSSFTAGNVARVYGRQAHVSYHGVDTTRFAPADASRSRRRPVVLSVGSLTPLKGFDFLVSALARCPAATRPSLVIASNAQNPAERLYLERLAASHDVRLELAGAVGDDDLVRLYNEASVVAYAPVREPFGLVPLEAMACATPVVAVREGGVPESVVDGHTGLLCDRDANQFATAIENLVWDRRLARRMGENGRDHVMRAWTWDHAIASLEEHLAAAAAGAASTSSSPVEDPGSPAALRRGVASQVRTNA